MSRTVPVVKVKDDNAPGGFVVKNKEDMAEGDVLFKGKGKGKGKPAGGNDGAIDLKKLKKDDLIALAIEKEIELKGDEKVADLVAIIEEHVEGDDEDNE